MDAPGSFALRHGMGRGSGLKEWVEMNPSPSIHLLLWELHRHLGHELLRYHGEHLFERGELLRREALLDALNHLVHVRRADVVVLEVLFRGTEMIFARVVLRLHLAHITLADETLAILYAALEDEMRMNSANSCTVGEPRA